MSEFHDPFIPDRVDESIEQILFTNQDDLHKQRPVNPDRQLIHDLQQHYTPERQRYLQALQRVENRLIERVAPQNKEISTRTTAPLWQQQASSWWQKQRKGKETFMQERQPSTSRLATIGRNASILVIMLLLVGSLALVFTYIHQRTPGTSGQPISPPPTATIIPTPTATPSPTIPIGTTLYTTSANSLGFNGISWSPDSKRVASSTINGVQIWDAVNGQHLINVQLPGTNEWPYALSWSPTSQLLAVATNQEVILVNGQSGQIISRHDTAVTTSIKPISSGSASLGDHFSDSGGLGYRAVTWSPDGKLIASALSLGPSGEIVVWNVTNNATQFTLNVSSNYNVGALAWSSDGQYLAASTWNTQGGDPTQPNNTILAWKVSTRQIIFQHKDSMNSSDGPIFWQPQSHNLAFNGQVSSGSAIEIWDVLAGTMVKELDNISSYGLAWSPEGNYLAYANNIGTGGRDTITIIDAKTEKQIYAYKEHKNNVSFIAWSPNGKYIASAEGNTQGAMLVKVWVAE